MIKIIRFKSGLGNQMFQYALFLALKHKYPHCLFAWNIKGSKGEHYGFELFKIFKIGREYRLLYRFLKLMGIPQKASVIFQPGNDSLTYHPSVLGDQPRLCRYDGYWQSEKYFEDVKPLVLDKFQFRTNLLNARTRKLADSLDNGIYCSIHVRRGDYLLEPEFNMCNVDYFLRAIAFVREKTGCSSFCVFSDDIAWVRENISLPGALYVDWNNDSDSWQDMYLMSRCSHNIIANSSFSWWGAWLNSNPDKVVVAPKVWFASQPSGDIVPDGWIRI